MSLKEDIEKKFGSLAKFAKAINKKESEVLKDLESDSNYLNMHYRKLVRETYQYLSEKTIEQIRGKIIRDYKRQRFFCIKYNFAESTISDIINGKHNHITPEVRRVCEILDIKI